MDQAQGLQITTITDRRGYLDFDINNLSCIYKTWTCVGVHISAKGFNETTWLGTSFIWYDRDVF